MVEAREIDQLDLGATAGFGDQVGGEALTREQEDLRLTRQCVSGQQGTDVPQTLQLVHTNLPGGGLHLADGEYPARLLRRVGADYDVQLVVLLVLTAGDEGGLTAAGRPPRVSGAA